jgi:dethiobiotin synthetase
VIVVVTGTGTDVGKTWVTAATIECLRSWGMSVRASKPVQSFAPGDEGTTDADVLARASGEAPDAVCPRHRWLPVAVAPPMAAAALGLPAFSIADLAAEVRERRPADDAFFFVEGAGGVRSPIADDGDTAALAHALAADRVVVVADAGLGTINAVRLTVAALSSWTPIIVLNRYDDDNALHRQNRTWLSVRDGLRVTAGPGVADEIAFG